MGDSNTYWFPEFDDDLVTYRGLFSTNLADFSDLELSSGRRRDLRQRVFFFCAVTSLALVLPPAIFVVVAVRSDSRADSTVAIVAYVLFALSVTGVCYVLWRGFALCRAIRRSARVYRSERPDISTVDEESALLESSPLPCPRPPTPPLPRSPLLVVLPPPPPPPTRPPLPHPPPVRLPRPLSTTARPILAQPGRQAPPTAVTSGRSPPVGGSTDGAGQLYIDDFMQLD